MSKRLLIFLVVLINSTASYLLWTHELRSKVDAISYLKYSFRENALFPLTSIPISFLTSLSLLLVITLFVKKQKTVNYLAFLLVMFLMTVLSFYSFQYALVAVLNTFFKKAIFAYLLAVFLTLPIYSWLTVLCINQLLIKTKKVFILWFWIAVILTIPLGMLSMLTLHSNRIYYSTFVLDITQKGYPVFWINIIVAVTAYIYFNRMKLKTGVE